MCKMIEYAISLIEQGQAEYAVDVLKNILKKRKLGKFNHPDIVYEKYKWMAELEQEEMIILCLDSQNRLIKDIRLFKGTADSAFACPRDIMREAVRVNAVGIILIHNHPGGDNTPSEYDKTATKAIYLAGQTLDIRLLDHIIISDQGFFSFKNNYLL